jgi:hypothetical protein
MQLSDQPPSWSQIVGNFAAEGGDLVDLYVRHPASRGWDAVLKVICEQHYPNKLWIDSDRVQLPESFAPIRHARLSGSSCYMEFCVGNVRLVGHFFGHDEVELSIKPHQVRGPAEFDPLCEFIKRLGDEVDQPVVLVEEFEPEKPFLTYDPIDRKWQFLESRAN